MTEETKGETEVPESPETGGETDAAGELEVLFPDVGLSVNDPDSGEAVSLTVREFRFREGLEAQAVGRDLIAALAAHAGGEERPALDTVMVDALIGEHADAWLALIAVACGRRAAWLERLRERDARAVSLAMWEANSDFFFRAHRGRGRGGETAVALAEVLDELVRAGHARGHAELCERLTWRQMERFWRAAMRRRAALAVFPEH